MKLVRIVDVSYWQCATKPIDWDALVGQEKDIKGVFIRAGYGTMPDSRFEENWVNSLGKLLRGPYLYFLHRQDPVEQVRRVFDAINSSGLSSDFPFVLDLERNGKEPYPDKTYLTKVKSALYEAETLFKKRPIIYTSPSFANSYLQDREIGTYPLWIANYRVNSPQVPWPWFQDPVGWQFGSLQVGRYYGVNSPALDLNIFDIDKLL